MEVSKKINFNILIIGCSLNDELSISEPVDDSDEVETTYDGFNIIKNSISCELKRNLTFRYINASKTHEYSDLSDISGIIVGGSEYMLSSGDSEWIRELKNYLRNAAEKHMPILGICFGHQLLAQIFGAEIVKKLPREFGRKKVSLSDKGKKDKLFHGLNERFDVYESHCDIVVNIEHGIESLCFNQHNKNQAIAIGNYIRGVQFHPEFNHKFMRGIWYSWKTKLINEDQDIQKIWEQLEGNLDTKIILDNFINYFVFERDNIPRGK